MKTIRYGILGPGYIAHRFVEAVNLSEYGLVEAVASTSQKRADEFASRHNIKKAYDSYSALLNDPHVDIVYISNRHNDHFDTILQVLESNKHVLVEKPMVLTKQQAVECFQMAKKKNLFLMEAQKMPFLPLMNEIFKQIQNNEIGELRFIETSFCYADRFEEGHWMISKQHGGGLYGTASYGLTLIALLANSPTRSILAAAALYDNQADRYGVATIHFENDLIATTRFATDLVSENKAYIYGSNGYYIIEDFWKNDHATKVVNHKAETLSVKTENDMVYEINHVNECLHKNLIESWIMDSTISIQLAYLIETIKKRVSP